jgi:glycosyltransferase involved in cell wall biosynthesis
LVNIGMILENDFPPDIRVEKEARSLSAAGHTVSLLCPGSGARPSQEQVGDIVVRRFNKRDYSLPRRAAGQATFYYHLFHPLFYQQMNRFVEEQGIDVLHVHDLPLVGTGLRLSEKNNLPLVADLHENYPAAVAYYRTPLYVRPLSRPPRWRVYERACLPRATAVIVVVEEARERLLADGLSGKDITIVSNTVDTDRYWDGLADGDDQAGKHGDGTFIICYAGGFGRLRGLECLIRALGHLRRERIRLRLIGQRGRDHRPLQKLARRLGVSDRMEILPWQSGRRIGPLVRSADVCVVPHLRNEHTDTTVPHKLFQYMYLEKPVVVSDCRPLRRIVRETGCGLVFRSGDAADLAGAIRRLLSDRERCLEFGRYGKRAVMRKYNWVRDARKLIKLYRNLAFGLSTGHPESSIQESGNG